MKFGRDHFILMFGEFTDRVNFYGIQSILILYLMHVFLLTPQISLTIYGIYSSLSFVSPLIGGYCADKFFNRYKSILVGIIFILVGNIFLLFSSKSMLFLGIDLVIIGIGFFKPNNITLFGSLCTNSEKQYVAFTLYYATMTLGAILGPFLYSTLSVIIGWKYGFIFSIILLLISLVFYLLRLKFINKFDRCPQISKINIVKIVLSILTMFGMIYMCLQFNLLFTILIWGSGGAMVGFLIYSLKPLAKLQRNQQIFLIILMCFGLFFYAVSFQVSSSLLLYANKYVDAKIFGFIILPEYFMAIYSVFIAISAVLSTKFFRNRTKITNNILINKINIGLYLAGFSFIILSGSAVIANSIINWQLILILLGLFILGLGELAVGPIINSAIAMLVPQNKNGAFMGLWCLLIGYAAYLSSLVAKMVNSTNYIDTYCIYFQNFLIVGVTTLIIAVSMTLMKKTLNRLTLN